MTRLSRPAAHRLIPAPVLAMLTAIRPVVLAKLRAAVQLRLREVA